jgi:hypothetical protein
MFFYICCPTVSVQKYSGQLKTEISLNDCNKTISSVCRGVCVCVCLCVFLCVCVCVFATLLALSQAVYSSVFTFTSYLSRASKLAKSESLGPSQHFPEDADMGMGIAI